MARKFARQFYASKKWEQVRLQAIIRDHGMCQYPGCTKPVEEVHHIIHLNPNNITDPEVALNLDNLQCLCREHHFKVHEHDKEKGLHSQRKHFRPCKQAEYLDKIEFVDGVPVLTE